MSPVAVALRLEDAEAKAAETLAEIAEAESFLASFDELFAEAVRAEVRSGKTGDAATLQKRHDAAVKALPRLRSRLAAFDEIVAERAAELATARRAELQTHGDELDAQEQEALQAVVSEFRSLRAAVSAWKTVQAERESFAVVHPELAGYARSRLDPVPRSFRGLIDDLYVAVCDPESLGDPSRQLRGWEGFV